MVLIFTPGGTGSLPRVVLIFTPGGTDLYPGGTDLITPGGTDLYPGSGPGVVLLIFSPQHLQTRNNTISVPNRMHIWYGRSYNGLIHTRVNCCGV